MDNGRTTPTNDNQPFFTAGQGVDDIDNNTFGAENNLDTSSSKNAEWNIASPERNLGAIGDAAMGSHERTSEAARNQELGEIVDMAMPPGAPSPEALPENSDVDNLRGTNSDKGAHNIETGASATADTLNAVKKFYEGKMDPDTLVVRAHEDSNMYLEKEFGREFGKGFAGGIKQ